MSKPIFFTVLLVLVSGCASEPEMMPLPKAPEAPRAVRPRPAPSKEEELRIDYIGLQADLGLKVPVTKLGYREKAFDTCSAGHGFWHSADCHREYFVLIQFQLLCRPSESDGFSELTAEDTSVLSTRPIDWLLLNHKGQIFTDENGYGQILTSFRNSPRERHIKLNSGRRFLHMEAGDVRRIVAPPNWCPR